MLWRSPSRSISSCRWFWVLQRRPIAAVRKDLTATVVASGRVQTPFRSEIGSQITGVVASVPVDEGQTVHKGQVLITLESSDLQAGATQAAAAVAAARAKLVQIQDVALPSARANKAQTVAALTNARLTYDRLKRLLDQDSIARADFDTAQRTLDTAVAQDQAEALQVATNAPGGADRVLAETQLTQAEAALASAKAKLAYTVIRAPVDGVLISRKVEHGNVAAPGVVLMVLSPNADIQLLINVDEKNLGRLALGQSAVASADAYPERTFPARVVCINPGIDAATAAVAVKLDAPHPPGFLRQDMTVSVDILSSRRPGALVIPSDAVRQTAAGQTFVLLAQGGRAVARPIKVGVRAGGSAEVLSGLRDGDQVFAASAKLKSGQRVRPHA